MWRRTAAGKTLTFRLAGINNQNFLMRDEETGSYWQQVTGRAISGPLSGTALELLSTDETTFALFRDEQPQGTVLQPVGEFAKQYAPKDWDVRMAKARTVLDFPQSGVEPRELILGAQLGNASRAWPSTRVLDAKVVQDRVGETPVVLVAGPDGRSIRAFISRVQGKETQFFREASSREISGEWSLTDAATSSRWNFRGCATSGPAQGTCLEPVGVLKDYWFDWRNFHPRTTVYRR